MSSSQVEAKLLRPLLRNAGFKKEIENLTLAERGLLYALRDFVQFRKTFSVQVASAHYGVLGSRDTVRNSFLNLQSSRKNAERTRALAREGRVTQSDLGRLEQQELQAERDWINAIRDYKRSLDDFKLMQLGLPVDSQLVLDDRDLEALAIRHSEISEVGVKIAERRVEEQNLLAELGRAKAQDQVDAQNDLINSKNQRTQALVGHTIARLQFWVNMGILYVKDNGRWEEVTNVKPE